MLEYIILGRHIFLETMQKYISIYIEVFETYVAPFSYALIFDLSRIFYVIFNLRFRRKGMIYGKG